MGSKYPILPLVDLVTIHDTKRKPITKSKRVPGNYPYYGASGITDYVEGFVFDGLYVLLAEDGDNLRTRNTPIAFIAQGKFWVNNHAHVLKGVDDLDTQYICYALQYAEIESYISGSTRPKITQGDLKKIPISAPSIEIRHAIAKFISEFDKKIELNRQTNQTLEQMAQALFKSWFVDFDPVFDNLLASVDFKLENLETSLPDELILKAQRRLATLNSLENAAQYKASLSALAHELQAQLPTKEAPQATVSAAETPVKANLNGNPKILVQHANTHAHFPNEFEHNEQLGWIPKGWSTFKFEDICVAKQGKYLAKEKMTEVPDEESYFAVWGGNGIRGYSCNYMYEEPVVVLTCRGSNCGLIDLTLAKAWVSNISFACTPRLGSVNFLHLLLSSINFSDCTSGSAQPQITYTSIKNKQIFYPLNSQVVNKFSEIIDKLYSKKIHNTEQSKSLSKLRDTLLPKLISGELQIPDVATGEKAVD
jgi:type I restriction enzyme S subunit